MLKRLDDTGAAEMVDFTFDGVALRSRRGTSVAAALLENDILALRRSPASGEPRSPYCLMGACFECLVTVDESRNRQACLTLLTDGMCIRSEAL